MTLPVAPKSSAAPKSKKAVAVELRIKYLSADSRAVFRSTAAQSAYRPSESSSSPRKIAIKFAAPAISIAPHALHSMIAVVPATRGGGPDRAVEQQRAGRPNQHDLFEDRRESAGHETAEERIVLMAELPSCNDGRGQHSQQPDDD